MSAPKISIITAVRNGAATIRTALESVAAQTWPLVEHVVVDGGSTDQTVEIVRSCSSRVSSLVSERDRGIYDAFNKGVARCTGDVVAFLNADDFYASPDVLARVAEVFGRSDCDSVFGDAAFVNPDRLDRVVRLYDSSTFRRDRIRYGVMPAHPATFIRRRVYMKYGPFDDSYRIAGDFEFVARTFGVAGISYEYLPGPLVVMRTGGVSTSGYRSKQLISREIVRACRQNGIRSSRLHAAVRYLWKLRQLGPGTRSGVTPFARPSS